MNSTTATVANAALVAAEYETTGQLSPLRFTVRKVPGYWRADCPACGAVIDGQMSRATAARMIEHLRECRALAH